MRWTPLLEVSFTLEEKHLKRLMTCSPSHQGIMGEPGLNPRACHLILLTERLPESAQISHCASLKRYILVNRFWFRKLPCTLVKNQVTTQRKPFWKYWPFKVSRPCTSRRWKYSTKAFTFLTDSKQHSLSRQRYHRNDPSFSFIMVLLKPRALATWNRIENSISDLECCIERNSGHKGRQGKNTRGNSKKLKLLLHTSPALL